MANRGAGIIERWFKRCEGDGEFVRTGRSSPYSVIVPKGNRDCVVFTTKPGPVGLALSEALSKRGTGVVGRYGLPERDDVPWPRGIVGKRALLFLGDLDAADLLVFAWLRAHFGDRVKHLGVNDRYLSRLKKPLPESFVMRSTKLEREGLEILAKVFADYQAVVGRKCAQLLNEGKKIELEAVVSAVGPEGLLGPMTR